MENTKVFADGFIFKRNENAPEFVIGGISIKVEEAQKFLSANQNNGWVNLDVKQSKSGKYYMELNTFTPKSSNSETPVPKKDNFKVAAGADLPF
jgi:hypothetical protein